MSHHQPLAGRAAIVTGGALGIGGGTARRLAADGASILIVDIVEDAAQRNAQRINDAGGTATYMVGDVAQEDVAKAMIERCVDEYGRLDILIQNAYGGGVGRDGSAVDVEPDAWRTGMDLLVGAQFLGAKYGVPAMEASGPPDTFEIPEWKGAGRPARRATQDGSRQNRQHLIGTRFATGPKGIDLRSRKGRSSRTDTPDGSRFRAIRHHRQRHRAGAYRHRARRGDVGRTRQ